MIRASFFCAGDWGRGTPDGLVGESDWLEAVIGDRVVGEAKPETRLNLALYHMPNGLLGLSS